LTYLENNLLKLQPNQDW